MFGWRIVSQEPDIVKRSDWSDRTIHTTVVSPHTMNAHENEEEGYFRCPIPTEQAKAVLYVGRRRMAVTVQEASIDAFTILVKPRHASKLKVSRVWVLEYDDTRTEIHPEWIFNAPDGQVQLGLRRVQDLTAVARPHSSVLRRVSGARSEDPSLSAAAYGGFVMFLFILMALPGLGDRLGTAKRIQDTISWVIQGVDQSISEGF
jgi:hypothetical protein